MRRLTPFIHLILSFALLLSGAFLTYGPEVHFGAFVAAWCGGLLIMRYIWPSPHESGAVEWISYSILAYLAFAAAFIYWLHPLGLISFCIALVALVAFYPLKRVKKRPTPSKQP